MIQIQQLLKIICTSLLAGWAGCFGLVTAEASAQAWRPCGPDTLPQCIKNMVPQGAGGADFRPACQQHDDAYASGCCCKSRAVVDCEFLNNMLNECPCSRNPGMCRKRAWHYYRLVRRFGERQWQRYR